MEMVVSTLLAPADSLSLKHMASRVRVHRLFPDTSRPRENWYTDFTDWHRSAQIQRGEKISSACHHRPRWRRIWTTHPKNVCVLRKFPVVRKPQRFYYHRNQQYRITALCDNTGAVTEHYAYTAYGEPTILDGAGTTLRTASFIGNPYPYISQELDAESGLYHFNSHMYEGRKGRFLSHDPIGYPDGGPSRQPTLWYRATLSLPEY